MSREECESEFASHTRFREELPGIIDSIVETCADPEDFASINAEPIPSQAVVIDLIYRLREILFPGYFSKERLDPVTLKYQLGQAVSTVFEVLAGYAGPLRGATPTLLSTHPADEERIARLQQAARGWNPQLQPLRPLGGRVDR